MKYRFWLALWLSAASMPPESPEPAATPELAAPAVALAALPAVPAVPSGASDAPALPPAPACAMLTPAAAGRNAAAKMGPPGKRVTACSAPLRIALAPALRAALNGRAGAAVTRAALADAETPVPGPSVPILVVILVLLAERVRPARSGAAPVAKKIPGRRPAP